MSLVTFAQVKRHCLIDHDEDDAKVTEIVLHASAIVLDYLKVASDNWQDTAGEPADVPAPVEAATLIVAGALYENRDGSEGNAPTPLSQTVMDLLHRFRDPAFA